ncbi:MAG: hypothetical protein ABIH69_06845 [bacterium]|nr:hypothetical protein [Candidatus Margulisiibacteriota bacterium]
MKSEHDIFLEILGILNKLKVPYMIGGSIASIAYGEPRLTLDMDVVVDLEPKQAKQLAGSLGPEYYVSLASIKKAIVNRGHFNIIQSEAGIKVDFYVLVDDEMGRLQFSRKRINAFDENNKAFFASPEDVILKKLEWHKMGQSQKHLDDIKGILRISGAKLDFKYIDEWSVKLGVRGIWQELKEDV